MQSLTPDAATVAAGAPVEVDLTPIADGQIVKVFWRGKLIFVRHRTRQEIKAAEDVNVATLRDPQTDSARVKEGHAKWLIVYGNCTHLGCVPLGHQGEYEGWFCPCHGSIFDTVRPRSRRSGPDQPARPALCLHCPIPRSSSAKRLRRNSATASFSATVHSIRRYS